MLTISERKALHDGFGKVGNVKPRLVGLPVSPAKPKRYHGDPGMQMFVWSALFAAFVMAVCYFVFGGK